MRFSFTVRPVFLALTGLAGSLACTSGGRWRSVPPAPASAPAPASFSAAAPTPPSAPHADSLTPLVSCANERGWAAESMGDLVQVRVDELAMVEYRYDASRNMVMDVKFLRPLPPQEVLSQTAFARQRGNDVYACAGYPTPLYIKANESASPPVQHASAPAQPPQVYASQPSPETHTACQRLSNCYIEVAQQACVPGDAHCREEFRLRAEESEEEGCRRGLERVNRRIEEIRRERTRFVLPPACVDSGAPIAMEPRAPLPAFAPQPAPSQRGGAMPMPAGNTWPGHWNVSIEYGWECRGPAGRPAETGRDNGRWPLELTGEGHELNGAIRVEHGAFAVHGSATEHEMRLCGSLPLHALGEALPGRQNVCINANKQGAQERFAGRAEGTFSTDRGQECHLTSGSAELTR